MLRRLAPTLPLACIVTCVACGSDENDGTPNSPDASPDAAPSGSPLRAYADPGELGLFPIGVVTKAFVDETRPELATLDADDHRTLPTTIWYPAGEDARDAAKATRGELLPAPVSTLLRAAGAPGILDEPTNGVADAAIAEGGPFPLIVFSHGNGGLGVQSYFLTEFLASHGYIVVCPDHTGNSLLTELPGSLTVPQGGEADASGVGVYAIENATADRIADVSFLVDAMTELDASDPDGRFTAAVDLDHVGITGHSFGGLTSLLGIEQDDRFDVAAPMAPAAPDMSAIDRPLMYFWATEDQTLPLAPAHANYESATGPKMFISVRDAGHFSFSNGCPFGIGNEDGCGTGTRLETGETFTFLEDARVHAITIFYQTALWGYYLKDVPAYAEDLEAEPFSVDVAIERDGMP